jgi:hypothetical protein
MPVQIAQKLMLMQPNFVFLQGFTSSIRPRMMSAPGISEGKSSRERGGHLFGRNLVTREACTESAAFCGASCSRSVRSARALRGAGPGTDHRACDAGGGDRRHADSAGTIGNFVYRQRCRTGRTVRSRSGRSRIDRPANENLLASRFPAKGNSQPALPFQSFQRAPWLQRGRNMKLKM